MTTLLLDCGNTRIKWQLRAPDGIRAAGVVELATAEAADALALLLDSWAVDAVAISSVRNKAATAEMAEGLKSRFSCRVFVAEVSACACGIENGYHQPQRLGVDRWMAAIGAYKKLSSAVVIVDAGSAITVDYVDARGVFRGGYIAPGLKLLCGALQLGTEDVHFSTDYDNKEMSAGLSTDEAVARGLMHMAMGYIRSAQDEIARQNKGDSVPVIMTGGDALSLLAVMQEEHDYIESLVLDGLNWVFEEEVVDEL
ncbi:Type III pantothenate kinase [Sinobacterium norvegicum]|uniref:Type III pantothenate kinase n=1 Tax=Sinobacterium norvegicum TaxID=1641715 RepID=A0ABM9AJ96_9GAMM|nr:type III pantothenate kinase [Sinobacterium norvegicum]CAH0993220.1 Type III pantothenate kinase [Sinobacterium norvegicum]